MYIFRFRYLTPFLIVLVLLVLSCKKKGKDNASISNEMPSAINDSVLSKKKAYISPGLDHGFEQSPINIQSKDSVFGNQHTITLYFKDEVNKIENLGHTIQLDFQEGSTISYDDTLYNFKQCHFHTPSEHWIDSVQYAMEMHIVNVLADAPKNNPKYLVVGVLFKEGKENKFLNDFLKAIPKDVESSKDVKPGMVKLSDLFGVIPEKLKGHYYKYKGSLTTPPYTEAVTWFIAKHIYEASPSQIEAIRKIEGDNARHVQALYGRVVKSK